MSYTFEIVANTKANAIALANDHFDGIVAQQKEHAVDMPAARAAVAAYVNLLTNTAGIDVRVQVNGTVWTDDVIGTRTVSVGIVANWDAPGAPVAEFDSVAAESSTEK